MERSTTLPSFRDYAKASPAKVEEAPQPKDDTSYAVEPSHQDVHSGVVGSVNGIPRLDRIKPANEDTAIWMLELRRRMNLTQPVLAEELGVSAATIGSWERGDTRPSKGMTDGVLRAYAHDQGMPNPPEGGKGWTPMGPRFAEGIAERFRELFGE